MRTATMALQLLLASARELAEVRLAESTAPENDELTRAEKRGASAAYETVARVIERLQAEGFSDSDQEFSALFSEDDLIQ